MRVYVNHRRTLLFRKTYVGDGINLPIAVSRERSLATHREPIEEMELHSFRDARGHGVATAYAVVYQATATSQSLV